MGKKKRKEGEEEERRKRWREEEERKGEEEERKEEEKRRERKNTEETANSHNKKTCQCDWFHHLTLHTQASNFRASFENCLAVHSTLKFPSAGIVTNFEGYPTS